MHRDGNIMAHRGKPATEKEKKNISRTLSRIWEEEWVAAFSCEEWMDQFTTGDSAHPSGSIYIAHQKLMSERGQNSVQNDVRNHECSDLNRMEVCSAESWNPSVPTKETVHATHRSKSQQLISEGHKTTLCDAACGMDSASMHVPSLLQSSASWDAQHTKKLPLLQSPTSWDAPPSAKLRLLLGSASWGTKPRGPAAWRWWCRDARPLPAWAWLWHSCGYIQQN